MGFLVHAVRPATAMPDRRADRERSHGNAGNPNALSGLQRGGADFDSCPRGPNQFRRRPRNAVPITTAPPILSTWLRFTNDQLVA